LGTARVSAWRLSEVQDWIAKVREKRAQGRRNNPWPFSIREAQAAEARDITKQARRSRGKANQLAERKKGVKFTNGKREAEKLAIAPAVCPLESSGANPVPIGKAHPLTLNDLMRLTENCHVSTIDPG
jgi:cysteine sulfinate desulfinase/cysteine desulfurase-like protein